MTIETLNITVSHVADGIDTVYSYNYKILLASHLEVYFDDVLQSSGYTVDPAGVGSPTGGDVTFSVPPAASVVVKFTRNVPYTQLTDYRAYDNFPAETHETALDKLTMMVQQLYQSFITAVVPTSLDDIADVNAPSPNDNDALTWDSGTGRWIPEAIVGNGHTIEQSTVALTQRAALNFGDGLEATDNAATDATDVALSATGLSSITVAADDKVFAERADGSTVVITANQLGAETPVSLDGYTFKQRVFLTTAGSGSYSPSAGTAFIRAQIQGPGGGGGYSGIVANLAGGGGGEGALTTKDYLVSALSVPVPYVVGAGGVGGTSGAGGTGGQSSFNTTVIAGGGVGGAAPGAGGGGGSGGTGSGGDFSLTGAGGSPGDTDTGSAPTSGAGGGRGGKAIAGGAVGQVGAKGGGGSGGATDTTSGRAGGAGGDGWIIIDEYLDESAVIASSVIGGYGLIEDEGTPEVARTTLNFVGAGVSVTDSSGKTQVNIDDVVSGGASGSMTGADKAKLDNILANAQPNLIIEDVVNGVMPTTSTDAILRGSVMVSDQGGGLLNFRLRGEPAVLSPGTTKFYGIDGLGNYGYYDQPTINSQQEASTGTIIPNIIIMTQAEYDGLATKVTDTVYVISG